MDAKELEEKLQEAVADLKVVAAGLKPGGAWRDFQELTIEEFWQSWPEIRAWGEFLYQLISKERDEKAEPATGSEYDELGGPG
ncbi:MAG: hypothetical protein ACRDH6_03260 [Actinomycetota bacterium]